MATISFEGAYGTKALTCENSGKLKVTLHEAVGSGCQLMVSSVADGQKMFAEPIEAGAEEATLDISALAPGLYAVSLIKEGEVADTKCFSNK